MLWVFWGSGSLDTTCPVTLCFWTGYKVIWAVVSTRVTFLCTEVQNNVFKVVCMYVFKVFFFTQYEYTRVKFGWCFFSYHLIMPRCLMHHCPSVIKKERNEMKWKNNRWKFQHAIDYFDVILYVLWCDSSSIFSVLSFLMFFMLVFTFVLIDLLSLVILISRLIFLKSTLHCNVIT